MQTETAAAPADRAPLFFYHPPASCMLRDWPGGPRLWCFAIGSYSFFDPEHGPNTNVVLRVRDAQKLAQAKRAVDDMLERVRRAQSRS